MYQYLGDTEIVLYKLLNNLSLVMIFVFNLANFRRKKALPSKLSVLCSEYCSKKHFPAFFSNANLWVFLEIMLVAFFQYGVVYYIGANGFVGALVGTEANYFGTLIFSPFFVQLICLLLSVNPLKQMDLITPAYPFVLIFIKLACFCAGCCAGIECSFGLYNHRSGLTEFPVQLVEAGLAAIIFVILLLIRKKVKEGYLYPIYVILYSVTRFFSEFLRCEENIIWIFKIYHLLCLVGIVSAVVQLFIIRKNKDKILEAYEKSCYIIVDFVNIALLGFGVKKEKKGLHQKKNRRKGDYQPLQKEVKFDFSTMRIWILIWTLGLVGQIGWGVENSWFNTFIYEKFDKNPSILTPMLILGSIATIISVFIFGTLADRTGKRRNFINSGFIIWGILLAGFGLTQFLVRDFFSIAIVAVVVIDMLISFFASMSTDVGYNIWLTDVMNDKNRGQIGATIAVQNVLGSFLATIIGGMLIGTENNYIKMFLVMGSILIIAGILAKSLFNKKDDVLPVIKDTFFKQLTGGINFKEFFKHKELVWVHISIAVFFTGLNIYYPHLGNYLIHYLGFSAIEMSAIGAFPLTLAMIVTAPISKYLNKNKFFEITLLSIFSGLLGVLLLYTITAETNDILNLRLMTGIFFIGVGFITMIQATKVWTKKLYPTDSKGQYEIFWAISYALIPIFFGSIVGEKIVKLTGFISIDEVTDRIEYIPNGNIFILGALISTLSIIPIMITNKYSKKRLVETVENK